MAGGDGLIHSRGLRARSRENAACSPVKTRFGEPSPVLASPRAALHRCVHTPQGRGEENLVRQEDLWSRELWEVASSTHVWRPFRLPTLAANLPLEKMNPCRRGWAWAAREEAGTCSTPLTTPLTRGDSCWDRCCAPLPAPGVCNCAQSLSPPCGCSPPLEKREMTPEFSSCKNCQGLFSSRTAFPPSASESAAL